MKIGLEDKHLAHSWEEKLGFPQILYSPIHFPLPSPAAALEKIAQQTEALGGEDRLGVKLDPIHRQFAVTQPHDLPRSLFS